MKIQFLKYQGTGNDFIMIDNRPDVFPPDGHLVRSLCDRKFGIGADGLILMSRSDRSDFRMQYFNSDGEESTMCGNGGRCIAAFARKTGWPALSCTFDAIDGVHQALVIKEEEKTCIVRLKIKDVNIPYSWTLESVIDTGSPHVVVPVKNIHELDILKMGREVRYSDLFREHGVNVNFVENCGNMNYIRTYERGVENETLSCGTGTVASALVMALTHPDIRGQVAFQTSGGELVVHFKMKGSQFSDIWLEGPATFVFQGEVVI
jgi:diaminopimelate epimerase